MRICWLLPSATEIVCDLGLMGSLVGGAPRPRARAALGAGESALGTLEAHARPDRPTRARAQRGSGVHPLGAWVVDAPYHGLHLRRACRPAPIRRIRVTTTTSDVIVFVLLGTLIVIGELLTLGYNVFGSGYDYRETVAPRSRSLWYDPQPSLMADTPVGYQIHAALSWLLYAVWPFSRLVHVWSIPLQYLGRPYILYRSRYGTRARSRAAG